jgi:hypothetical protein
MHIYTTPHYILTEYNKTQIKNDIAPSPHDGTIISFAEGKNGYDSFPITYSMQWADIKKRVIDKNTIPGMHGCTFKPNATSKTHDQAIDRYWLMLDFDTSGCDPVYIMDKIKQYVYMGWTSFSSNAPSKNGGMNQHRLKFAVPIKTPVPLADWGDDDNAPDGWMRDALNGVVEELGFIGVNRWDQTARTFAHIQYMPGFNRDTAYTNERGNPQIDIWINDDVGTSFIDLYALCPKPITAPAKVQKPATSSQTSGQATGVASTPLGVPAGAAEGLSDMDKAFIAKCKLSATMRQEVVDMVLATPWLTRSSYGTGLDAYGNEDKTLTLTSMCCAIQLIGSNTKQWGDIYNHMTSGLTVSASNTAAQTWGKQWNRKNKLIISLTNNKIMQLHHKKQFGYTTNTIDYAAYTAERIAAETVPDTKAVVYLDENDLTSSAKVTVVIWDTGIGKTTALKKLQKSGKANVRTAVPTQIVRDQQSDDSIQTYDSVHKIIFEDDSKPEVFALDEAHNLPTMGFRAAAEIKTYDHIQDKAMRYSKIILLSATLDVAMARMIAKINSGVIDDADIEIIKRTKLNGPKKYYRVVEKANPKYDYTQILTQQIVDELHKGRLVYVVNDSGKINEKVSEALREMKVDTMVVSRDAINNNKNTKYTKFCRNLHDFVTTDDFKMIPSVDIDDEGEMRESSVDVIITTRIGCEGVNVCDEVDAVSIICVGDLDPTYIRQSSGRFRKAKSIDVIHLQSNIRKTPDIDGYIAKRRYEMAARLEGVKLWMASNPDPTYADWLRFASSGLKTESAWAQAHIEDGIWFDKESCSVREVSQLAELTLQATIDKAKFYADPRCQEIYMECAGFIIEAMQLVDYVDIDVIEALDKVKEEIQSNNKKTKDEKIAEWTAGLNKVFEELNGAPLTGLAIKKLAKLLLVDPSIIAKVNNLVEPDERVKWMVDSAINGWHCDEIAWRYVSDTSDIVRVIGLKYPSGKFLTAIECGEVAQDVLTEQIKRMHAYGITDIQTRLAASTSIWASCADKVDFSTGTVLNKKGFSQWISRNGFLNLEKSKTRIGGKQVMGHEVI